MVCFRGKNYETVEYLYIEMQEAWECVARDNIEKLYGIITKLLLQEIDAKGGETKY